VVFVDDNPGELLTVGLQCPGVALVRARADADRTADALRWQPGLWRWTGDSAAAVRAGDLAANASRERLLHEARTWIGTWRSSGSGPRSAWIGRSS